jgi:flagellar basal-body rod protein FlgB
MLKNLLFGHESIQLVKKALDAYSLRQKVIASNIANASTPGFKSKKVAFEENLKRALNRNREMNMRAENGKHFPIGKESLEDMKLKIEEPGEGVNPGAVNDVDIDLEMASLAENTIRYQTAVFSLSRKYSRLKEAIQGRIK